MNYKQTHYLRGKRLNLFIYKLPGYSEKYGKYKTLKEDFVTHIVLLRIYSTRFRLHLLAFLLSLEDFDNIELFEAVIVCDYTKPTNGLLIYVIAANYYNKEPLKP